MSFQPNYPGPGGPQYQQAQPQNGGFPNAGPMKPPGPGSQFPMPGNAPQQQQGGYAQNGAPQFNGNNGYNNNFNQNQSGAPQQQSNGYPQMPSSNGSGAPGGPFPPGPQPPSSMASNGFPQQQQPAPGQKPGFQPPAATGGSYQPSPNMQQPSSQPNSFAPSAPQQQPPASSAPQMGQPQLSQAPPTLSNGPPAMTSSNQQQQGMGGQQQTPVSPPNFASSQPQPFPVPGGPPKTSGAPSIGGPPNMAGPPTMQGVPGPQPPTSTGGSGQAPGMSGPPQSMRGPTGMPGQAPGMPQMPGQAPGMPQMPNQAPGMPQRPQMPGQDPGMPQMPGQAPGMPQMPSQAPGMPQMPSQAPGMPQMPGQAPGMPQMPGQAPGMPGMPQMPGQAPGMMPGQAQGMPQMPGQAPGMPGMMPGQAPGMPGMPQMPGQAPGMPGMPGQAPGMPGQAPGMPGGYPGAMPQPQRQKLDPNMMPSAVAVMEDDSVRAGLFPTGYPHAEPPPLVSTNFWAQDQGNCNPRLMRSTMYVAPATNDMLKSSQLPFAVACSPFAKLHQNEYAPPVIDLGTIGPVRCQRCKAYMCPFMEFQDGGRRFRCPFCHASTPVDEGYFAHLDHTGRRTDIEHRPELFLGAYEFVATKQYCKNGLPPKEPAFIFMIDVSYNALNNGMVHTLCKNLEKVLLSLPKETNQPESSIRVGLATFDQAVHFYDLSAGKPSMMIVGDVGEMFVPIVDGLLLPYMEALPGIRAVLAEIPRLFSQNKTTETMLGPVVNAGMDALKCADRAGKLFIFTTSLPTMEAPGQLKTKNERATLGTDKEKVALTPQTEFYTKAGEQCVKNGVTVDLFLFPNAFIDVATVSQLTAVTGGSVYKYQYFMPEKDGPRFLTDLEQDVAKQIGFDCMVRVRSSAGIRPITFSGSFYMENSTDLEMSSLDQDKAFFAELKHDDKLSDPSAIVQCAVLYTAISGQRRLRILNLCLPVSSDYNQLYRVADQDTLTTYMLRTAVQLNKEKGNKEMKDYLAQRSAQILATYREKCSENAPLGQLILPETLKLLPLYVNSIIKNDAVSGGSEMTVDDKVWMIELIRSLPVTNAMKLLYPRVFAVSQLEAQDPSEITSLPSAVRASTEYLEHDKAYLIDNGLVLFLWIGLGIPEVWVQECFGVQAATQIDSESHVIPEKDNSRSRALRRVIHMLEEGSKKRKLFIIKEKDALEPWMRKFLVEDKSCQNSMSYVDFLCHVHREIRNILS